MNPAPNMNPVLRSYMAYAGGYLILGPAVTGVCAWIDRRRRARRTRIDGAGLTAHDADGTATAHLDSEDAWLRSPARLQLTRCGICGAPDHLAMTCTSGNVRELRRRLGADHPERN